MNVRINTQLLLSRVLYHLSYTPILGLAALIGLIRIGIYARLLDVDEFGLLSKLLLISSFFYVVGSFGFQLLAQRDIPARFAEGRYRKGIIILGRAGIVTSITALAVSLVPLSGYSPLGVTALAFLFAVLHGWGQQIYMLVVIDIRSRLEMMRYSWQILVRAVFSAAVAVIVAAMGGGAIGIVVAELVITVMLTAKMMEHLLNSTRLSITTFTKLSAKGFNKTEWQVSMVLLVGTVLAFLSISADRWIAAARLSSTEFGLYSFAWISLVVAMSVQALLNAGIFPLIAQRRVAGGSDTNALRITTIVSGGLLIVGLITAFIANALAAWAIPRWYPQYINALPLFPPLLLAAAFRVSDFWSSYLIIVHRHHLLLKIQFILILVPLLYYWLNSSEPSRMLVPHNFALLALFLAVGNYILNAFSAFAGRAKATT